MSNEPTIIIIHESFRESVRSDLFSLVTVVSLACFFILVDMEFMFYITVLAVLFYILKVPESRMSIEEARIKLDELEKEFNR